jgi:hypothetical protein
MPSYKICCVLLLLLSASAVFVGAQEGFDDSDLPCDHYGDQDDRAKTLKYKESCCIARKGTCMTCSVGLGLVDGKCKVCKVKDCAACDGDVNSCQQYAPKDSIDHCRSSSISSSFRCNACSAGYRMSIDQTQCQKCLGEGCGACWGGLGACEKCLPFYRMGKTSGKSNGRCKRCSDRNCVSCDDDIGICTRCYDPRASYGSDSMPAKDAPGYRDAYGLRNGKCVRCGEGELACEDGKATECLGGYVLDKSKTKCVKTSTDPYKPPKEIPNCVSYSRDDYDAGACIQCKDGYGGYPEDKKCSKCGENCSSCNQSARSCDFCDPGYGRTRDGKCRKCPEHSTDCYDNGSGLPLVQCQTGYVGDDEAWECKKCEDPRCKRCSSPSQCIVCGEDVKGGKKVAFYSPDNASGTCVKCPKNMQYCTNGRSICEPGYSLSKEGTACNKD